MAKRIRTGEAGSGMTEFVIVLPLFVLLVFWSQYFTDLGIVRLKTYEAARYASWEMVAQRPPGVVQSEVQARFRDLRSPTDREYTKPYGMRTFSLADITNVTVKDMDQAEFGRGELTNGNTSGIFGRIMQYLTKFLNKAAKFFLETYKFDTRGLASSEVTFRVNNVFLPKTGGWLYKLFFTNDPAVMRVTMTAKGPPLLVNTWKAWPGKYAQSSKDLNANPYDTYSRPPSGGASAPEKEVSARLGGVRGQNGVAFAGIGSVLGFIDRIANFVNLPSVANAGTWADKRGPQHGPVVMLPGDRQSASWKPGYGAPLARVGHLYNSNTTKTTRGVPSNEPDRTDHYRFTTPSYVTTEWWRDKFGRDSRVATGYATNANSNPYIKMYRCRDAFYMGSRQGELKRWKNDSWPQQAFQGCQ